MWGLSNAFLVVLFVGFSGEEEDTDFWALGTALKKQRARWLDILRDGRPRAQRSDLHPQREFRRLGGG